MASDVRCLLSTHNLKIHKSEMDRSAETNYIVPSPKGMPHGAKEHLSDPLLCT